MHQLINFNKFWGPEKDHFGGFDGLVCSKHNLLR